MVGGPGGKAMEIPGAGEGQQGDHTRKQDEVADALGEERIAGPFDHQGLVVPGAHDQIGAEGEQFKNDVTEKQRIGEHKGAQSRFKKA